MSRARLAGPAAAALIYVVVAVVMTWPIAATAGSRLASDLGDPAFVSWVLSWDAGRMLKGLSGDVAALAGYWNANIFYPEPLTLAYSEHFTAQALQILPVYAATGNIILSYNILFISTFVLAGLAVYLLVAELTGRPLAALLAGFAYAYAPYRMGQFSHLQVLSSYWMPLALLGFHRYFVRVSAGQQGGRLAGPLAGGAASVVMQNLSCGYFMLFFAPFVAAYCAYEIVQRRLAGSRRVWGHLGVAAVGIAAATWPFVQPYLAFQQHTGMARTTAEIVSFSADAHALATVASGTRLFGDTIRAYVKPEGEGFPGFTILASAAIALAWGLGRAVVRLPWRTMSDALAIAIAASGIVTAAAAAVVTVFFVAGSIDVPSASQTLIYRNASPALVVFGVAGVGWLMLMAVARRDGAGASDSAFGYMALAALAAALLAMGPRITAAGVPLATGPYAWLLALPGWDGLRVPARYLTLVTLFLAVLAGLGAAAILRRAQRLAIPIVLIASAGVLAEAWIVPAPTNLPVPPGEGLEYPPAPRAGRDISPLYGMVRDWPGSVVLAEFPFGDNAYELQAVFYAGYHLRPILNGYSGYFPPGYTALAGALGDALTSPEEAAEALRASGATHALVHEAAFSGGRGHLVSEWLEAMGARLAARDGDDVLYVLGTTGEAGARGAPGVTGMMGDRNRMRASFP